MTLFAGGSESITDITDLPNRRILDEAIYYDEEIIVGDCPGADLAIQEYLKRRDYYNVVVYASGDKVRHNVGDWEVRFVSFDPTLEGYDFYRQKDIQMELDCDRAVMAWDGKSKGTKQNTIDLMALGKHVHNMLWKSELDEWYYMDGSVSAEFLFGEGWGDRPLRLWLDDLRPAPDGYLGCRSVAEAQLYVTTAERNDVKIADIDCDHDLGIYANLGGDGIKLLDWLAERGTFYPVSIHTMNPVGRDNMQRVIDRYWR